jgi:hypothetical protein
MHQPKEIDGRELAESLPYIGEYFQPDSRVYYKTDADIAIAERDKLFKLLSEVYGCLLQADRDGEAHIPESLGKAIEEALGGTYD